MQVHLYDTTLRDGMQGEGMSLSVDEKLRVAHALDGLGVHLIEAGFPSSNPKEEALFELLERPPQDPALIVGLPVGFVGAAEAKEALAQSDHPCVTNRGERGGSSVAVAAVNALLYYEA